MRSCDAFPSVRTIERMLECRRTILGFRVLPATGRTSSYAYVALRTKELLEYRFYMIRQSS